MYELVQAGARTFFVECPAKIGMFLTDDGAFFIDSGNGKDAAKKALKHCNERQWELWGVFNTHSHADHIGGNRFLAEKTNCSLFCPEGEVGFACHTLLEPSQLWGSSPPQELRNHFLLAPESATEVLSEAVLPQGLTFFPLPGHSQDMVGFRTEDGVCFLGDALVSEGTIEKYHIPFLYDVAKFLESLAQVEALEGALCVPSHAPATEHIAPLVEKNRAQVFAVAQAILEAARSPVMFEDILKALFDRFALAMDFNQYALVGSTLRAYLSYLYDAGQLATGFYENKMLWERV